jgi:hypothetical protein
MDLTTTTRADIVQEGIALHGTEPPEPTGPAGSEEAVFQAILHPEDSYNESGVYWADLPFLQRVKYVGRTDRDEAFKELRQIGQMMKKDPLSPISFYFTHYVIPGMGLGLEGYVLFSIGNLTPLFQKVWPSCWSKYKTCNEQWVDAVTYLEVLGIVCGQILVGVLGDW